LGFPCSRLAAIMEIKPSTSRKTVLRMPLRFSLAE
jgi:hypothetical protein